MDLLSDERLRAVARGDDRPEDMDPQAAGISHEEMQEKAIRSDLAPRTWRRAMAFLRSTFPSQGVLEPEDPEIPLLARIVDMRSQLEEVIMSSVAHYSGGLAIDDIDPKNIKKALPQANKAGIIGLVISGSGNEIAGGRDHGSDDGLGEVNSDIGSDLDEEEEDKQEKLEDNTKRISIYASNLAKQLGLPENSLDASADVDAQADAGDGDDSFVV